MPGTTPLQNQGECLEHAQQRGIVRPIMRHSGRIMYAGGQVPRSDGPSQALSRSTDNPLAAFLTFLAEEQVSARTARLYLLTFAKYTAAGEPSFELVRQHSERRQLHEPQ